MIRILLVGPLPPAVGGDTRHFMTLVADLERHDGFHVRVVNTSRGAENHSNSWQNLIVAGRTLLNVLGAMRETDIVSFHASNRGMVLFAPWINALCKLARRPVVLRLFGGSFGDYYASRSPFSKALIRLWVLSADAVLVQTRRAVGQLQGQGRCEVHWFSTYVDSVSRPPSVPYSKEDRCTRFVFLGHLWRDKGIDTILDAAATLPDGCSLDIYGPLDEYTPEQIRDRGQGRVCYRGILSHDQIGTMLWDYDCLVLPTFHPSEGYPGVIAEAFVHELPVITTRWLAIPEIVDESCGTLIEPGDAAAFSAAVRAMHDDPERWRQMKRAAKERAAQFDHDVWARTFEQICMHLVRN